jgi:hypothetical protein
MNVMNFFVKHFLPASCCSFFDQNNLLSTLFSYTLNVPLPLFRLRDQVPFPEIITEAKLNAWSN